MPTDNQGGPAVAGPPSTDALAAAGRDYGSILREPSPQLMDALANPEVLSFFAPGGQL